MAIRTGANETLHRLYARLGEQPGDLLSPKEAAEMIGCTRQHLSNLRASGQGPGYIRLSPTMIRYRAFDLATWLDQFIVVPRGERPARKRLPPHRRRVTL